MPGTNNLFIGLMSGTSVDAIDAVLVRFKDNPASTEFLAMLEHPFPDELRDEIHQLIDNSRSVDLDQLGSLDRRLGLLYAEAVRNLLTKAGISPEQVTAIGNHGQTIRHRQILGTEPLSCGHTCRAKVAHPRQERLVAACSHDSHIDHSVCTRLSTRNH